MLAVTAAAHSGVPFSMVWTRTSDGKGTEGDVIEEVLSLLAADFPEHVAGTRPVHTVGAGAVGWFRPTEIAHRYCKAPHFSHGSETPVRVRFSNGNGQPDPDGRLQVRGMAIRFYINGTLVEVDGGARHTGTGEAAPDGADDDAIVQRGAPPIVMTDLLCASIPVFMSRSIEQFIAFQKAMLPRKVRRPSLMARLKSLVTMCPIPPQEHGVTESGAVGGFAFANGSRPAQGFAVESSMLRVPDSYARTMYHAVHAFAMEDPKGRVRMVRFLLEPADGVHAKGPGEPAHSLIGAALKQPTINAYGETLPERYLTNELAERLARGPCRFNLRVQVADPWDDTTDPTTAWPMNRQRILLGTITLQRMVDKPDTECEQLSFNPGRLIDGIGPSDDPVFAARVAIYEESYRRRMTASGLAVPVDECPVHRLKASSDTVSSVI